MAMPLSRTFKSVKPHSNSVLPLAKPPKIPPTTILPQSQSSKEPSCSSSDSTSSPINPWTVYLILSTNPPIKTYVGVTNNFSRRLKQHNGELIGGAKASRAGRPWTCACLIQGFTDKSEAYQLESKWKIISRKLPRKRNGKNEEEKAERLLLQHRYSALNKLEGLIDCTHLDINWHLDPTTFSMLD